MSADDARESQRLVNLDLRNDLDGLAAMIEGLDVVVSVDTSLAHLAGAMGRRVHVLLARVPDWRWGLAGDRTPWYASATLHRQHASGDWSLPAASVAAALEDLAQRRDG